MKNKEKTASLRSRPPLERMMKIHQAIQSGSFPNNTTLARELEVSTKSIQRDMDFMRDRLNLPVMYDGSKFGYYYTQDVVSFPSLQITEGELFSLVVAEKAMQQYRGTSFEKPLVAAMKKMADSLPDTISINWADWDQTISFRTSAEPVLNLAIFDKLAKATAKKQQLSVQYRKPGAQKPESRIIDPYHLANINGDWFLFAFCHLRGDIRTFVPSRMEKVEVTGKTFTRPARFSMSQRLRDSFNVHSGQGNYKVVIQFSAEVADYIREKKWHPSQNMRVLSGGRVELQFQLSSLVEIERWILTWGQHAVVVEPKELIKSLKQTAVSICEQYSKY